MRTMMTCTLSATLAPRAHTTWVVHVKLKLSFGPVEAFAEKLGFVPPDDILGKNVITPPEVIVILHAVG